MVENKSVLNIVLSVFLVLSLGMLVVENFTSITGHATDQATTSNVTISSYLAIQMSSNLSAGIYFGDVKVLPTFY